MECRYKSSVLGCTIKLCVSRKTKIEFNLVTPNRIITYETTIKLQSQIIFEQNGIIETVSD